MENLLPLILLAACPVGMGLAMWFMGRGMNMGGKGRAQYSPAADADPEQRLAILQAEREVLETRIRLEEEQRARDARRGQATR